MRKVTHMVSDSSSNTRDSSPHTEELLRELVAHLRHSRTQLREEWARRITEAKLLTAMSKEEIFAEATALYDNYVEAVESGTLQALQTYARISRTYSIRAAWKPTKSLASYCSFAMYSRAFPICAVSQ